MSEWISVEDRLPKIYQNCAVYINGGRDHKYYRWARFNGGYNWDGDGGCNMSHCYADGAHNITHWMPLPEPPKQGEE